MAGSTRAEMAPRSRRLDRVPLRTAPCREPGPAAGKAPDPVNQVRQALSVRLLGHGFREDEAPGSPSRQAPQPDSLAGSPKPERAPNRGESSSTIGLHAEITFPCTAARACTGAAERAYCA